MSSKEQGKLTQIAAALDDVVGGFDVACVLDGNNKNVRQPDDIGCAWKETIFNIVSFQAHSKSFQTFA